MSEVEEIIPERNRFATTHFEVLICQTQAYQIQTCNSQVRLNLNFNHPCIELLWAVRRSCNEKCNAHFHYGGIDGRDPVVTAALYLNNQARFQGKPGTYFRLVKGVWDWETHAIANNRGMWGREAPICAAAA